MRTIKLITPSSFKVSVMARFSEFRECPSATLKFKEIIV